MQTEQHIAAGPRRGGFDCLQCGRSLLPIRLKAQGARLSVRTGSVADAFTKMSFSQTKSVQEVLKKTIQALNPLTLKNRKKQRSTSPDFLTSSVFSAQQCRSSKSNRRFGSFPKTFQHL